ncbi:hypothetical protein [Edaphobacter bradus]|uniref:hypothetical protein n=1 Tax=Edaphobacter bradus TaxID=2259016 RepID=UPI0021DF9212|nr:hypothetical protein [Edaphobacter bradus]
MKKLLMLVPIMLLASSVSYAQSATATANLSVNVGAEAAIVVNSSPAFTSSGIFGNYTSTTALTYYVRTITAGTITVQITTDFSTGGVGGGPSVANPPTSGDALTYTCTAAAPVTGSATACATAQTASTGSATSVVTFGATTQSAKTGNSASTSWSLTNDPSYKAGSYSAVATYTISAT